MTYVCHSAQEHLYCYEQKSPKLWQYVNRKTTSKTEVGDFHWTDSSGWDIIADNDTDKAAALQDFFSSVYTVEPGRNLIVLTNMSKIITKISKFAITKDNVYSKWWN